MNNIDCKECRHFNIYTHFCDMKDEVLNSTQASVGECEDFTKKVFNKKLEYGEERYRLVVVNGGCEPLVSGSILTLDELIERLEIEAVECDLDALVFEINNNGPDKVLLSGEWPVELSDSPKWEKK